MDFICLSIQNQKLHDYDLYVYSKTSIIQTSIFRNTL